MGSEMKGLILIKLKSILFFRHFFLEDISNRIFYYLLDTLGGRLHMEYSERRVREITAAITTFPRVTFFILNLIGRGVIQSLKNSYSSLELAVRELFWR